MLSENGISAGGKEKKKKNKKKARQKKEHMTFRGTSMNFKDDKDVNDFHLELEKELAQPFRDLIQVLAEEDMLAANDNNKMFLPPVSECVKKLVRKYGRHPDEALSEAGLKTSNDLNLSSTSRLRHDKDSNHDFNGYEIIRDDFVKMIQEEDVNNILSPDDAARIHEYIEKDNKIVNYRGIINHKPGKWGAGPFYTKLTRNISCLNVLFIFSIFG